MYGDRAAVALPPAPLDGGWGSDLPSPCCAATALSPTPWVPSQGTDPPSLGPSCCCSAPCSLGPESGLWPATLGGIPLPLSASLAWATMVPFHLLVCAVAVYCSTFHGAQVTVWAPKLKPQLCWKYVHAQSQTLTPPLQPSILCFRTQELWWFHVALSPGPYLAYRFKCQHLRLGVQRRSQLELPLHGVKGEEEDSSSFWQWGLQKLYLPLLPWIPAGCPQFWALRTTLSWSLKKLTSADKASWRHTSMPSLELESLYSLSQCPRGHLQAKSFPMKAVWKGRERWWLLEMLSHHQWSAIENTHSKKIWNHQKYTTA